MVEKQPIIQNLQDKANEAKAKARWWDNVSWAGFFAGIIADFTGKPSTARTIVSWSSLGAMIFAIAKSWSWGSRADALQESVNEVRNAPETNADGKQIEWRQKIALEPSQDVAPTVIGR